MLGFAGSPNLPCYISSFCQFNEPSAIDWGCEHRVKQLKHIPSHGARHKTSHEENEEEARDALLG